jgi:hypothetical protein
VMQARHLVQDSICYASQSWCCQSSSVYGNHTQVQSAQQCTTSNQVTLRRVMRQVAYATCKAVLITCRIVIMQTEVICLALASRCAPAQPQLLALDEFCSDYESAC